jgi:hypothetical protein
MEAPRTAPKHGSSAGHLIELHDPLRHIERVVVGKRCNAGAEHDPMRTFTGRGKKHFWRSNHFPPGGMMLAAPKFVVAQPVKLLGKVEVATVLQHRVFANWVVWREKSTKTHS